MGFRSKTSLKAKVPMTKTERKDLVAGLLFAMPWIICLLVFYAYPLISSIYYSFTDFNGFKVGEFVGFENYINLFKDNDETFWISIRNTLAYTIMAVPTTIIFSIGLAMVMNARVKLKGMFRTMAFLPTLVPAVAQGIIWQWLLNTQYGIVNTVIGWFGGPVIPWLDEPALTKPSLVIIALWGLGGSLIIFLAGLQDIPSSYYEAGMLDGANSWQRFRKITLPLLSPVIFFSLITNIIGALQQFTLPYLIGGSGGGSLNSMLFYNMKLYNFAFKEFSMGMANAMAWLMFIVVAGITVLMYKTSNRWVHYMGES